MMLESVIESRIYLCRKNIDLTRGLGLLVQCITCVTGSSQITENHEVEANI